MIFITRRKESSPGPMILSHVAEAVSRGEPSAKARFFPLIDSLKNEKDSTFLLENLLNLGVRLKSEHQDEAAGLVLQRLSQADVPAEIRKRAEREYGALLGSGSFTLRMEYLSSRFVSDNGLKAIAPMIGVTVLGQVAGTVLRGGLARTTFFRFLAQGWGRNAAASVGALAVEVPALVGLNHLVSPQPAGVSSGDEFLRTGLNLGVFRLLSGAGVAATFAGLLAVRHLEEYFHLRPVLDDATRDTDVLGDMARMLIGSTVGQGLLGRPWVKFRREIEVRSDSLVKFGELKKDPRIPMTGGVPAGAARSSLPTGMSLARQGDRRRVLSTEFLKFTGPKKPRVLEMSKDDDDLEDGPDAELSVIAATDWDLHRMFLSGARSSRGDIASSSKTQLSAVFSEISVAGRLPYALLIADALLMDSLGHFHRLEVFPILVRGLPPEDQLYFASQLYDKMDLRERTTSDLERHAEQLAAIFGDLHPNNFFPFLSRIQQDLLREESRPFALACLARIGAGKR